MRRYPLVLLFLVLAACGPRGPAIAPGPPVPVPPKERASIPTGAWRVVRFSCNLPLHHEAGMLAAVMVWGIVRVEIEGNRFTETLAGKSPSVGTITPRGRGFRVGWPSGAPRGFFDRAEAEPDGEGGWVLSRDGCISRLRRPSEAEVLPAFCVSKDSHALERRSRCRSGEQEARPKDWGLRRLP